MSVAAADAPIVEQAYAKLNLALHLRRKRDDGYHELDTLFAFVADGDTVAVRPAAALSLAIDGPMAAGLSAGEDNLVLRAARALAAAAGVEAGAAISLTKRLPVASGIGGGSADAAATLRALARLWQVAIPAGVAERLGADVPACVISRAGYATGLGWPVEPVASAALAGVPVLLANPGLPLATAAVFRGWDGVDRGPLGRGDPFAAARAGRNDMTAAAVALVPEIGALLDVLGAQPGVCLARMSGSGATCFALFDSDAARDRAAAKLARRRPGDWRLASHLI